jgi:hypothetical protein
VLLGVGGAVLMAGAALASVALAQAAKKWIDQLEESPAVMAQRHLQHLKVAAGAGSRAWWMTSPEEVADQAGMAAARHAHMPHPLRRRRGWRVVSVNRRDIG